MDIALIIPIVAIVSIFIVFPGMVFHYITLWRKQKTLEPDDERMLEDLWRSAKAMERRIETLEKLVDTHPEDGMPASRPSRSAFDQ
ncbi:envelope stress response membrane protein PspB [Henriciella sp.]|uniref:envelope stress response membrane protein PspB n=1 Tax=Henriciella sp. TaxID=1968823 RepID=UPI0026312C52|nr:envelope stress response membrane protein PspB [Henriciella sp.]